VEHIGNVLARLCGPPQPEAVATSLSLGVVPLADPGRYDHLRSQGQSAQAMEVSHAA
jgi:hypothetical protein